MNILQPGPGVGGHCIAVDPWFIVSTAPEQSNLIRTAREVNDSKPEWVLRKIDEAIEQTNAQNIALLGLAFKPDIDDLRESPALDIVQQVTGRYPSAQLSVVEPNIDTLPPILASAENVRLRDLGTALSEAEVVVLLVDHTGFKSIPEDSRNHFKLIDTRGIWKR